MHEEDEVFRRARAINAGREEADKEAAQFEERLRGQRERFVSAVGSLTATLADAVRAQTECPISTDVHEEGVVSAFVRFNNEPIYKIRLAVLQLDEDIDEPDGSEDWDVSFYVSFPESDPDDDRSLLGASTEEVLANGVDEILDGLAAQIAADGEIVAAAEAEAIFEAEADRRARQEARLDEIQRNLLRSREMRQKGWFVAIGALVIVVVLVIATSTS